MYLFREFSLDLNKEFRVALNTIFGISWYKSFLISSKIGLAFPFCLKNLNLYFFSIALYLLKGYLITDVRIWRRIALKISKLCDAACYRGYRHKLQLPVHGQRTRTNARTQRNHRLWKKRMSFS